MSFLRWLKPSTCYYHEDNLLMVTRGKREAEWLSSVIALNVNIYLSVLLLYKFMSSKYKTYSWTQDTSPQKYTFHHFSTVHIKHRNWELKFNAGRLFDLLIFWGVYLWKSFINRHKSPVSVILISSRFYTDTRLFIMHNKLMVIFNYIHVEYRDETRYCIINYL